MSVELANLIAKRYIARADAKAKQYPDGAYRPVKQGKEPDAVTVPWTRDDVLAHIEGRETFGHYFLDLDDSTKLFALDIDLEEDGKIPIMPSPAESGSDFTDADIASWEESFTLGKPREAWQNRAYVGRTYLKTQFRALAGELANVIHKPSGLDLECAVAYSGNKGIHVYGFTGRDSAHDAREGAELALELIGGFQKLELPFARYIHPKYPLLSIEIYPKQDVRPSGGFGNLMRLPLGRNLKSPKDPTFFVDLRAPMNQLVPRDPFWSLSAGAANPWADE